MKTKKALFFISLSMILAISGCENVNNSEKCNCSNKEIFEVVDAKGIVNYDENIQKWFISVHQEGTIDEVHMFFPCNLKDSYKIPNREVMFSGIASDLSLGITAPAGTSHLCVEISSINSLN